MSDITQPAIVHIDATATHQKWLVTMGDRQMIVHAHLFSEIRPKVHAWCEGNGVEPLPFLAGRHRVRAVTQGATGALHSNS